MTKERIASHISLRKFKIVDNVSPQLLGDVARIYFDPFEGKIGGVLKRDGTAQKFIVSIIKPEFAVYAVNADETEVLGVAGYKTMQGAFLKGSFSDMMRFYGLFGTLWRALIMSVLERETHPGELQMDGIAVDKNSRGMGVGTALLNAIFEKGKKFELHTVSLDVIDSNPRAMALYTRLGFNEVGSETTGPFRYIFGFHKSTKMRKHLKFSDG